MTKAASRRAARRSGCRRWCRFRAGRRSTRSTPRCWRSSMRARDDASGWHRRHDRRALRRGAARAASGRCAVCRRGGDGRVDHAARRWRASHGAYYSVPCRVGGPGPDRVGRRDDGDDRRARRRSGSRIRGSASAGGRSTIATICPSSRSKPQAVRQVLPDLLRDLGAAVSGRVGAPRGAARAARGRAATSRGSSASSRPAATPSSSRRCTPRWRPARRCGWRSRRRRGRSGSPRRPCRPSLRDLEIGSGVAADYDAWLQGGAA